MTLGTTLAETIKEERSHSKLAAERFAKYSKGEEGLLDLMVFEAEIQRIQTTLAGLIEERIPSASVQVALRGDDFKIFSMLSSSVIKCYDTNIKGDPLDILARNPLYAFGAFELRAWAQKEGLDLSWRAQSNDTTTWWAVSALPAVEKAFR